MRIGAATAVTMALLGRPRLHLMRAEEDPRLRQLFDTLSPSDQYSVLLQALVTSRSSGAGSVSRAVGVTVIGAVPGVAR